MNDGSTMHGVTFAAVLCWASVGWSDEKVVAIDAKRVTIGKHDGVLALDGKPVGAPNTSPSWREFLTDRGVMFKGPTNSSLVDFAAIRLKDGRLLAVGGGETVHSPCAVSNFVDLTKWAEVEMWRMLSFDREGKRVESVTKKDQPEITPGPAPQYARLMGAAALLADGRVVVLGGCGKFPQYQPITGVELYDPSTRTFRTLGEKTLPRRDFVATTMKDGRVLITGGVTRTTDGHQELVAQAEVFDPRTMLISRVGSLLEPRYLHAAVPLADGRVMIVGGVNLGGQDLGPVLIEYFDPTREVFVPGPKLPTELNAPAAIQLPGGGDVLVSFGFTWQTVDAETDGMPSKMTGYIESGKAWLIHPR